MYDFVTKYSHLRGEDLNGLTLEELQRLESLLEGGLNRVLQTKVIILSYMSEYIHRALKCFLSYFRMNGLQTR